LRKIENTIIERAREAIITNGHFLSSGFSILPERIIGRSGSTHGARIVSTQAKKEMSKSVIGIKLSNKKDSDIIIIYLNLFLTILKLSFRDLLHRYFLTIF